MKITNALHTFRSTAYTALDMLLRECQSVYAYVLSHIYVAYCQSFVGVIFK